MTVALILTIEDNVTRVSVYCQGAGADWLGGNERVRLITIGIPVPGRQRWSQTRFSTLTN